MGIESPNQGNEWKKRDEMVAKWNEANGPMLAEAIEDAETVEDIISAVKVCGIRDERTEGKVLIKFHRGMAVRQGESDDILGTRKVSLVEANIRQAAAHLEEGNVLAARQNLHDSPNEIIQKLEEIVKPK